MLILKVRAVMAREATVISDPGGNASDDVGPAVLQEQAAICHAMRFWSRSMHWNPTNRPSSSP